MICKKCKSKDITMIYGGVDNGGKITKVYKCNKCKKTWTVNK